MSVPKCGRCHARPIRPLQANYKRAYVVTQVLTACEEAMRKAPERLAGAVSFAQLVRRLDNALSRFSHPQGRAFAGPRSTDLESQADAALQLPVVLAGCGAGLYIYRSFTLVSLPTA